MIVQLHEYLENKIIPLTEQHIKSGNTYVNYLGHHPIVIALNSYLQEFNQDLYTNIHSHREEIKIKHKNKGTLITLMTTSTLEEWYLLSKTPVPGHLITFYQEFDPSEEEPDERIWITFKEKE